MNHTEIIQYLIDKNNYKTYLEIGVTGGNNFNVIRFDILPPLKQWDS